MAGNPQAMAQLRSLLATREPLYALSDAIVDTSNQSVDASFQDLQKSVQPILYPDKQPLAAIEETQIKAE